MKFSRELQEKIKVLFKNNEELREKLLSGDADSIRQIGLLSQKGVSTEDVVDAYESKDSETMEYLYKKAKKVLELQELYRELCLEYIEKKDSEKNVER